MINWTQEQVGAINAVLSSNENFIISAVAGSGKSTLVKHLAGELIQRGEKKVFVSSFTNVAVNEITIKGVIAKTTTKLGNIFLGNYYWSEENTKRGRVKRSNPSFDKYSYLSNKVLRDAGYDDKQRRRMFQFVRPMVDMVRQIYAEPNEYEFAWELCFGKIPYDNEVESLIENILQEGINRFLWNNVTDYIDSLWLVEKLDMPLNGRVYTGKGKEYFDFPDPKETVFFVDEFQDCSRGDNLLFQRLSNAGAQIIIVGDERQAIYAWRGGYNSLTTAKKEFNATQLFITKTLRCPKSHSKFIREYETGFGEVVNYAPLHDNFWSQKDESGKIVKIKSYDELKDLIIPKKTVITGPYFNGKNSDLLPPLRWVLENTDFTVKVEGVDLYEKCKMLLGYMKENDYGVSQISHAVSEIIENAERKMDWDDNVFINLKELQETLEFSVLVLSLCSDCNTAHDYEYFIKNNINVENPDIVFSTGHKVKGQTYQCVVVANFHTGPRYDTRNADIVNEQQANLFYVLLSRSSDLMILTDFGGE